MKIDAKDAKSIFRDISRDYKTFAPIRRAGRGRFSGTDLITYDRVNSFDEIEFFQKSYYSAKEVLFPIRQTLFEFQDSNVQETEERFSPTIIFMRACDINAISVTDSHFLKNGDYEDIYYKRRRDMVKLFLMECEIPFENCFCVSSGTNRSDKYAAFMRKTQDGYEVKVKDTDIKRYFSNGKEDDVEPRFVEEDLLPIDLPEDVDISIFEDEMWKEYSLRCIACGRCNTSCPTCTCFTSQDILPEEGLDMGHRRRIWSSCQVKDFDLLAGNHDFRIPKGDRMRYKVLHKIRDFRRRTTFNMCVGCGRCDDVCPEYISMFKCIEKINHIIERHG